MLNTVKEGLESNNSLILNSQSGAIINKPVEPDLQAIYEDIIEAFRKHGYGDWLEIAAKKAIEATINI